MTEGVDLDRRAIRGDRLVHLSKLRQIITDVETNRAAVYPRNALGASERGHSFLVHLKLLIAHCQIEVGICIGRLTIDYPFKDLRCLPRTIVQKRVGSPVKEL